MEDRVSLKKDSRVSRNMFLYILGRLTSLFGTNIYDFAISLFILKVTGSAELFSICLAIAMITKVAFSSFAGVLTDKIDRKKIVVGSDIGCGIALAILVGVAYIDTLRISYIFVATFILSLLNVFFDVAMTSSLPNITNSNNLTRVNSLNTSVTSITQIFAPIIGGVIYVMIDMEIFLLIDAVSFIISGLTEVFIDFHISEDETSQDEASEGSGGFKEGINFIKKNRVIASIAIFSTVINFLLQFGVVIPIPYIVNNVLKLSETRYGIIQSLFAISMLVIGIILSILPEKEKCFNKILLGMIGFVVGITLMGIVIMPLGFEFSDDMYFYLYSIFIVVISMSVPLISIPLFVKLQKIVPDNLRGRVFGVVTTIAGVIAPLGTLLSGILLENIPIYLLPLSSAVVLIITILVVFGNKEMRGI